MLIELQDGDIITYDLSEYDCAITSIRYDEWFDGPCTINTDKNIVLKIVRNNKVLYEKQ